jgi:multicomponent K+:H+ antiporter subunit E
MKRLLPSPWLSLALLGFWIMLHPGVTPGQTLLGAFVAWAVPLLLAPLRTSTGPLRRPGVLLRLVLRVGGDVVRSGLDVGRGVLRSRSRPPRGGFVVVPLDIRQPHSLAALAVITAVIPGTVWTELAADRSAVLLHVFDLQGEDEFVAHYKQCYELPLKEIFE